MKSIDTLTDGLIQFSLLLVLGRLRLLSRLLRLPRGNCGLVQGYLIVIVFEGILIVLKSFSGLDAFSSRVWESWDSKIDWIFLEVRGILTKLLYLFVIF